KPDHARLALPTADMACPRGPMRHSRSHIRYDDPCRLPRKDCAFASGSVALLTPTAAPDFTWITRLYRHPLSAIPPLSNRPPAIELAMIRPPIFTPRSTIFRRPVMP